MTNFGLLDHSKQLHTTATAIIKDNNITEIFSQLGKVEVIGSLRLDLMYRHDIDLLVISDDIDKSKAQTATKQLLDLGSIRTVAMADYQTFPGDDMPLGFYWELVVIRDNQSWKFDIWYLKPAERYTHLVFDSIQKFSAALAKNPEKAKLILEIKQAYFDGIKYKNKVKSIDIYNAVLVEGISSVAEFSGRSSIG